MPHRITTQNSNAGEPAQATVLAMLGDPKTHRGIDVVRIDTPISHIFIAGPTTYKLKRAVKRNFVDYSTAELRKKHCQSEVRINSKYAPGIYKGVVPVVRANDRLNLGGEGEAIDYVVEMATFDPALTFDRLAESGELTDSLIHEFADTIAEIHHVVLDSKRPLHRC